MSLDDEFGRLRGPQSVDPWEVHRLPLSKCMLTQDVGRSLSDLRKICSSQLLRYAARTLTYIWAMDGAGDIHLAVEELAETVDGITVQGYPRRRNFPVHPAEEKKLGHPTLLDGGEARVAGEFFLDEKNGTLFWFVNVGSGRYCQLTPPTAEQIESVLRHFRQIVEEDVLLDDINEG